MPKKIILWLSEEQFPQRKIPKNLEWLRDKFHENFEILWYHDIRSYKKLIPALHSFKNIPIVTADDDAYYHPEWLERLWLSYQKNKDCIHAHMAIQVSSQPYIMWKSASSIKPELVNLGIGVGGILYPPNSLYHDILDEKIFQKISPLGDDLYFWAMAVLNTTRTKLVDNTLGHPQHTLNFWNGPNLYEKNCHENFNDIQFENILNFYPEIKNMF